MMTEAIAVSSELIAVNLGLERPLYLPWLHEFQAPQELQKNCIADCIEV